MLMTCIAVYIRPWYTMSYTSGYNVNTHMWEGWGDMGGAGKVWQEGGVVTATEV